MGRERYRVTKGKQRQREEGVKKGKGGKGGGKKMEGGEWGKETGEKGKSERRKTMKY